MSRPGEGGAGGAGGAGGERVLLAQQDTRSRLRTTAALRGRYELLPLQVDEDPLRAVRSQRPTLVLLEVPRGRSANTLRACRAIKTDAGTPPRVALLDPGARVQDPAAFVEACLADGYLGEATDDEGLRAFVADVLAGRRPIRPPHRPPPGLLQRLLRR